MKTQPQKESFIKKHWPLLLSASILLLLVGGYFIFPFYREGVQNAFSVITSKDETRIKAWVNQFGFGGPLVIVLLMMIQMFLLVVPNILIMMIAIIMYGPVWGSVVSIAGVFAASSFGYFIGRKAGPYTVKKLVSEKLLNKLEIFLKEYGVGAVAITRLSSISNDGLSIAAGALKMAYKKYIGATLAGTIPLVVLLAIFGKNGQVEKALIWIAAISMSLLVAYIIFDKKRKNAKRNQQDYKQSDHVHPIKSN